MYLSELSKFPDIPHWVILTTSSYDVPGDERSRTNPGHGYPAHTVTSINYNIYHSEEEWLKEIERRETSTSYNSKDYVAFKSSGKAKIEREVKIKVNNI